MDPINSGYMPFVDQVNQNRSLYFGISLSIPVLDGFKVRSDIRKANITLSQQKAEQKKTIFIQEKIHRQAIEEYRHALKEHKLYQVQLKSTQTSYEAMKERYALGLTTAMDLAKALLDYNLAELSLIRAKYLIIYNQEVLKILD
jgi:outer membrane protein